MWLQHICYLAGLILGFIKQIGPAFRHDNRTVLTQPYTMTLATYTVRRVGRIIKNVSGKIHNHPLTPFSWTVRLLNNNTAAGTTNFRCSNIEQYRRIRNNFFWKMHVMIQCDNFQCRGFWIIYNLIYLHTNARTLTRLIYIFNISNWFYLHYSP